MNSGQSPTGMNLTGGLVRAADAGELEQLIKGELTRRYDRQYASSVYAGNSVGPGTQTITAQPASMSQTAGGTAAENGGASETAPAYSDTNVQEKGVDEGDLVKTDGKYIYLARGTRFFILSASPVEDSAVLSDTELNEQISELYVSGSKIVVVTSPVTVYPVGVVALVSTTVIPFRPVTHVYVYDVTAPDAPILTASFDLPGHARGSRQIGNMLYLITNTTIDLPAPARPDDYISTGITVTDQQAYITACEMARQENLRKVQTTPLAELLPVYTSTTFSGGTGSSLSASAASPATTFVSIPGNGTDLSVVTSIELSSATPAVSTASIVTAASQVYVSRDSIYLASANSWQWIQPIAGTGMPSGNPEPGTTIHKFVFDASGKPVYKSSGVVDGWINDRFSMGDNHGYLRIGTTRGGWWGEGISNQLAVLAEDPAEPGRLTVVGKLAGLAPGERIYSMRFDRDRGYMVTFKQTDPLYTFDLADPTGPRLAGELKVNGFATYIHLLGTDTAPRLLTIGRAADTTGRVTGNKLQLFDVADLASPQLAGEYELGAGWSNALHDPHAFLYYQPLGVLAIPYTGYEPGTYAVSSGLQVFSVADNAITARGTVPAASEPSASGYYPDTVDRSLIIDNAIFSIAGRSVTIAGVEQLNIIKTVQLPQTYMSPGPASIPVQTTALPAS